jgi:hypothetical protein
MLLKTTLKLSLSLLVNTMLACILGVFLILGIASFGFYSWVAGLATLIVALIYWRMIYGTCWHEAEKDNNRISFNRMRKFMTKGFVAGLIATIPFLIVYILYVADMNNKLSPIFYLIYLIFNLPYFSFVAAFRSSAIVLALLFVPMPLMSWFGYLMGYRGFSFMNKIIYKNQKSKMMSKKSFR